MTKRKLLFITTGGTIASEVTDSGLAPELTTEQLLSHLPAISGICDVDCVQLLNLDSTNMQPEQWMELAGMIRKEYGRYDLAKEQKVPIYNDQGEVTNTLLIRDHKADMIDADCRDLLCVKQKAIDRSGETIVCLPNRVVVSVENAGQDALDGFAQ